MVPLLYVEKRAKSDSQGTLKTDWIMVWKMDYPLLWKCQQKHYDVFIEQKAIQYLTISVLWVYSCGLYCIIILWCMVFILALNISLLFWDLRR